MSAGTCTCGRGLIQQRVWEKATPAKRSLWLADGFTVLQGRGLCRACYLKAWKAGEFPRRGHASPQAAKKPCDRCGIPTTQGTCRDCVSVEAFA